MRRLILLSVLVLLLAVAYRSMGSPTAVGSRVSPTLPGPAPNAGDPAPTFAHERYDGGTFSLAEQGIYVLTFWDTLNRDSNQAQRYFAQLAEDFKGSGVRFAAIYIGDAPEDSGNLPYSVVDDDTGSLAAMYNVKRVPRVFIISDGRVYVVQNDFLLVNYDLLRGALEELVSLESETGSADR